MSNEPRINDRFPIRSEDQLSSPIVDPIHECAEAVYVHGFIPHAIIKVYANINELIGEDAPSFGFGQINLKRPLKLSESITATQTVGNTTSNHSKDPAIVSAYEPINGQFSKPELGKTLYDCGVVVPTGNLVPGVKIHIAEDGTEIASKPTSTTWDSVVTPPLHKDKLVTAQQIACGDDLAKQIKSNWSDPVKVLPIPSPIPSPSVDQQSLIVGNDTVTLNNLLVGAQIEIFDNGKRIMTGMAANGTSNFFPVNPPIQSTSAITATQELCGHVGQTPSAVKPNTELTPPVIIGPICQGAQFVVIRNTVINSNVVIFRNNSIVGYGGAVTGDLILSLGDNFTLNAGDVITAIQYIGSTISPISNSVTVVEHLEVPSIEILDGEPFFQNGQLKIDGPVFPRGRGKGPVINIQTCCNHSVKILIQSSTGEIVAKLKPLELFPGYFTANWDWQTLQGWSVPSGIPIGEYSIIIPPNGCHHREAQAKFYIIFNPDDVGGPSRFSFNDTAVWFGTDKNQTRSLLYNLHPYDSRVFSIAIQAAKGEIDPLKAAILITHAEDKLFQYSLDYHTNDVVDLIEHFKEAQCADDACCLTALLRSVGIPSHPVTADAAIETGAANWTFDTWVEFLTPVPNGTEWLVIHPHQYPNDPPMSRKDFGANKPVATKSFNDIIVMANENWGWSEAGDNSPDVTFNRNNCSEPEQTLNKKPWIGELCEIYWKNHWDCQNALRHPFRAQIYFEDIERHFEGVISGSIFLFNEGNNRTFGRMGIELVSHRTENKAFPEEIFDEISNKITLNPMEKLHVPFKLQLPSTIAPGQNIYLRVRVDERTVELHPIQFQSAFKSQIHSPKILQIGEVFEITAVVNNISNHNLNKLDLELKLPYAIRSDHSLELRIEELPPKSEHVYSWLVQAVSPMDAGTIKLTINASQGGSSLSTINVTVTNTETHLTNIYPGTHTKYKD